VNVASLALMAGVTWQLGQVTVVDPFAALISVVALVLLFRFRMNSAWLVVSGGAMGLAVRALFGG
jgi:chromate transporter